ncbi:MAG: phospholipid carrier-dependent glycosyltransferase [Chloroflexi bacterium]|nr:phospholipid carrier-dependent glycosyltransferase [Chloroflexota bacterium]
MKCTSRHIRLLLALILLTGGALRFYGLGWGTDEQTGVFHAFHPDETTLVTAAQWIGVDIDRIRASYGKAPMYLLWATEGITRLFTSQPDQNPPTRFTYLLARFLSAAFGTLTLWFTYRIGLRLDGPWTGLLGAALLAWSTGHIQQSHYFTVDVIFTCWTTLALWAMLCMPVSQKKPYLVAGLATGLAVGTRISGIWFIFPFLMAHLWPKQKTRPWWRTLWTSQTTWYLAVAAGVTLLCLPNLLLNPSNFFATDGDSLLLPSMAIARGETIRIWNLYDFSTTPYLEYLVHLFPYAMGLPVCLAALVGLALALQRRTPEARILLAWLFPYFLLVGGLHTRPYRYATPMLPVLALLAAWACIEVGRRIAWHRIHPVLPVLPALLVALPTFGFALATARIYGVEDARIQAARWVQQNIPEGEGVYVENGGFPTAWMAPPERYRPTVDKTGFFMDTDGAVPYFMKIQFIKERLDNAPWAILIEENRMRPYGAVPQRYPIAHEFYAHLAQGNLGYEQVATFKVFPGIGNWTWTQAGTEPTATAYDHPRVHIYKRTSNEAFENGFKIWVADVLTNPALPDLHLREGLEAISKEDWNTAQESFQKTVELRPNFVLGTILLHAIALRQNLPQETQATWDQLASIDGHKLIQALAALYDLEQNDLADEFLKIAIRRDPELNHKFRNAYVNLGRHLVNYSEWEKAESALRQALDFDGNHAETWYQLARAHLGAGQTDTAFGAVRNSLLLDPTLTSAQALYLNVAALYYRQGSEDRAEAIYRDALSYNPDLPEARYNLGVILLNKRRTQDALIQFRHAARLVPEDLSVQVGLGAAFMQAGRSDEAAAVFHRVLEKMPNHPEARAALETLQNRQTP